MRIVNSVKASCKDDSNLQVPTVVFRKAFSHSVHNILSFIYSTHIITNIPSRRKNGCSSKPGQTIGS